MAGRKQRGNSPDNPEDLLTNIEEIAPLNPEHERLLLWYRKVKFRRAVFGGLDESDVWRKLEELNDLYEASIRAERARYEALLEKRIRHDQNVLRVFLEMYYKKTGKRSSCTEE